jgi:hypothetical protein
VAGEPAAYRRVFVGGVVVDEVVDDLAGRALPLRRG